MLALTLMRCISPQTNGLVVSKTEPTKLIHALRTFHVITSIVFINPLSTSLSRTNLCSLHDVLYRRILFCFLPFDRIRSDVKLLARFTLMPGYIMYGTGFKPTASAPKNRVASPGCVDVPGFAARVNTPPKIQITTQGSPGYQSIVLLENIIAGASLHIRMFQNLRAFRASNLVPKLAFQAGGNPALQAIPARADFVIACLRNMIWKIIHFLCFAAHGAVSPRDNVEKSPLLF